MRRRKPAEAKGRVLGVVCACIAGRGRTPVTGMTATRSRIICRRRCCRPKRESVCRLRQFDGPKLCYIAVCATPMTDRMKGYMMTKPKYAVILVDMLNDFVYGPLTCENAKKVVQPLVKLTDAARAAGVPVIYSNDCHLKGIDHELKLWGDHAIKGTEGAEIIPELAAQPDDYIIPKRRYSGFFQTDMLITLQELGVDTVIITGLHAHMCCRHTSADAYQYGFDIVVPRETTNSFTDEEYEYGLKYLHDIYGARIVDLDELLAEGLK